MSSFNDVNFHGIVLYDIEFNGCLNGVYTNNDVNGLIFNEIAKKRGDVDSSIAGDYVCSYTENGDLLKQANLTISETNKKLNHTYTFVWKDIGGTTIFMGIGFKMNEKQIAVYYKKV